MGISSEVRSIRPMGTIGRLYWKTIWRDAATSSPLGVTRIILTSFWPGSRAGPLMMSGTVEMGFGTVSGAGLRHAVKLARQNTNIAVTKVENFECIMSPE